MAHVYFDDTDLSYAAEDAAIRRAADLWADLDAPVEIRKTRRRLTLWPGLRVDPWPA